MRCHRIQKSSVFTQQKTTNKYQYRTVFIEIIHNTSFSFVQKTLIHCRYGVSRSGAVAVAVAMHLHQADYATALTLVRAARPVIAPNSGFQRQLTLWHRMDFRLVVEDLHYQLFLMEHNESDELPGDVDPLMWGRAVSQAVMGVF
jgi:hypothetical protein